MLDEAHSKRIIHSALVTSCGPVQHSHAYHYNSAIIMHKVAKLFVGTEAIATKIWLVQCSATVDSVSELNDLNVLGLHMICHTTMYLYKNIVSYNRRWYWPIHVCTVTSEYKLKVFVLV